LEALLVTTPLEVSATTTQLVLTAATRLTRLILALVAVLVVLEAMAALETTAVDWVVSQVRTPKPFLEKFRAMVTVTCLTATTRTVTCPKPSQSLTLRLNITTPLLSYLPTLLFQVTNMILQVATPTVLPPLPAVLALHRLATTTLQDLTAATWLTRLIPASTLTVMELPPVTAPLVVLEPLPVTAPLEALDTTIQLAPTAATP
jgi:hypothetical protein